MREHKTISIADQIFEQLERDILTGKYQRGEVLSEIFSPCDALVFTLRAYPVVYQGSLIARLCKEEQA